MLDTPSTPPKKQNIKHFQNRFAHLLMQDFPMHGGHQSQHMNLALRRALILQDGASVPEKKGKGACPPDTLSTANM